MIDQELNIAILELFDELQAMDMFKTYKINEVKALHDPEVKRMIAEINRLCDLTYTISYQPSLDELMAKINDLRQSLESNEHYAAYLASYQECNHYLAYLSKIIFKDIIEVESEWFNED